jgi:16S rRNA (cytosine967-C5)-methyltransferase
MKRKSSRDLALQILNKLSAKTIHSHLYLDDLFIKNEDLKGRDRAFVSHLVLGVLRWQGRLDWVIDQKTAFSIKKISPTIRNILRLALYQIFFMDRVPDSAAVNEAVKQAKTSRSRQGVSFVNGLLRSVCRDKEGLPLPDREEALPHHLAVRYAYPEWLVNKWLKEWGQPFTEKLLDAGNTHPILTLRTNTLRTNRHALMTTFRDEGLDPKATLFSPEGIVLQGFRGRPDRIESFRDGLFQVQGEAAQLTAHILSPAPNDRVLDLCAGLGGKTTHLAALMGNQGRIVAMDINLKKLEKLRSNTFRLGIRTIQTVLGNSASPYPMPLRTSFDKILLDAPCSGLGVLSKHPDGKWNRNEADIERLSRLQESLVTNAAPLLKKGGHLLYETCKIYRPENEGVVDKVLSTCSNLSLLDIKKHLPHWGRNLSDNAGFLRTFPHIHGMEGFFAALFEKT